jgi:adenylate kinase family enzyme
MRITIIGLSGSGKSTLARAISNKLSIPHIHLDRFWFEGGGKTGEHDTPDIERVRAYVREKTLEAIAVDSWVSDGFYSRVQPEIAEQADVVLFLDIPLWKRLLSHAKRMLQPATRHKELN